MKTDLSNRVKPFRWKTINSEIQGIIKRYKVKPKTFLNVGAGKKPYALLILWYLCGATEIEIIEPDMIYNISEAAGIQELYWDLKWKEEINQNKDKKKNKIFNVLDKKHLFIGRDVAKIINTNSIKLHNTSVENAN